MDTNRFCIFAPRWADAAATAILPFPAKLYSIFSFQNVCLPQNSALNAFQPDCRLVTLHAGMETSHTTNFARAVILKKFLD